MQKDTETITSNKVKGQILSSSLGRVLISLFAVFALLLVPLNKISHSVDAVQAASVSAALSSCQSFTQVNDNAFGMDTGGDGGYSSEEGFEVIVFNSRLYLGMEGDNTYGARIWRTKSGVTVASSQADWEEVAADSNGKPFGVDNVTQNDHIDSLAEFNGYFYASTANGGSSKYGTRVFRTSSGDPGTWQDAIQAYGAGFGDLNNTNFKDMQVFDNHLCGGTQNWIVGTQVWCTTDGTTWEQKNISGFGEEYYNNRTVETWSGFVFDGAIYFGVQNLGTYRSTSSDDVGKLYRTSDLDNTPSWTEAFSGDPGSHRVDILGDLNGYLYISVRSQGGGIVILRSSNGNPGTWTQVNTTGMDGDQNNIGGVVDSATVHEGGLYVGVANTSGGFEMWRTSGSLQGGGLVDWEQVDTGGLGDNRNYYTQLVAFNSNLYAWTSNYTTGQQVLRSSCGDGDGGSTPSPTNTPQPTATSTPLPTATATPEPTATNTPEPTATSTPEPDTTNTPLPTATSTPEPGTTSTPLPTATSTPEPGTTSTPLPTATSTPEPDATNTPIPTTTSTPEPTATNTPEPTPTATGEPTAVCQSGTEGCGVSATSEPDQDFYFYLPLVMKNY